MLPPGADAPGSPSAIFEFLSYLRARPMRFARRLVLVVAAFVLTGSAAAPPPPKSDPLLDLNRSFRLRLRQGQETRSPPRDRLSSWKAIPWSCCIRGSLRGVDHPRAVHGPEGGRPRSAGDLPHAAAWR